MHLATEVDTVRTCKDRNAGPVAKYSKRDPYVRWLGFPREFRQTAGWLSSLKPRTTSRTGRRPNRNRTAGLKAPIAPTAPTPFPATVAPFEQGNTTRVEGPRSSNKGPGGSEKLGPHRDVEIAVLLPRQPPFMRSRYTQYPILSDKQD